MSDQPFTVYDWPGQEFFTTNLAATHRRFLGSTPRHGDGVDEVVLPLWGINRGFGGGGVVQYTGAVLCKVCISSRRTLFKACTTVDGKKKWQE